MVLAGLITWAVLRPKEKAKGFPLHVASIMRQAVCMDDDHRLVVTAQGNHRFTLNESGALTARDLSDRVNYEFRYRAQKAIFLRAESGVSYAEFTEMVDNVYRSDAVVVVATHEVERLENQGGCVFVHVRGNQ